MAIHKNKVILVLLKVLRAGGDKEERVGMGECRGWGREGGRVGTGDGA